MKIWVDVSCSFLIEAENHDEAIDKVYEIIYNANGGDIEIEGTDDYEEMR